MITAETAILAGRPFRDALLVVKSKTTTFYFSPNQVLDMGCFSLEGACPS